LLKSAKKLMPLIYNDLRRLAEQYLRRAGSRQTLPAALVVENKDRPLLSALSGGQ